MVKNSEFAKEKQRPGRRGGHYVHNGIAFLRKCVSTKMNIKMLFGEQQMAKGGIFHQA